MKCMIKRIGINLKYIGKTSIKYVSALYAVLGFVGTFTPLSDIYTGLLLKILPYTNAEEIPDIYLILGSLLVLLVTWLFISFIVTIRALKTTQIDVIEGNSGHKLYIQYGDIFSPDIVCKANERRNIVIPVNRCFDTIVDNNLVSETTLHGILFKRLYDKGKYDEHSLNCAIQSLLANVSAEDITVNEKPSGNIRRYPVGTVVDLPMSDQEHYLLWALSTFDCNLKAHTNMQEYALAVQKLIEACNIESEGFPVLIPLVGTGLSRTKKDQKDVLKYLINAFRLNRAEINCDIHIVLRDEIKEVISILENI